MILTRNRFEALLVKAKSELRTETHREILSKGYILQTQVRALMESDTETTQIIIKLTDKVIEQSKALKAMQKKTNKLEGEIARLKEVIKNDRKTD